MDRIERLNRRDLFPFIGRALNALVSLTYLALLKPARLETASSIFSEFYSDIWDYAEHSISHLDFNLPTSMGKGPVNRVNDLLLKLYGGKFASLSFGGSSGAILTLLTAVLPKLHPTRDLILFDDVCHQSTIGGIIFGRWKAVRLRRTHHPVHKTVLPLTLKDVEASLTRYGPNRFAAIILVLPSYEGFRSPSEDKEIYALAQSHGIKVIVDGAWDAVRFRQNPTECSPLQSICDVWITSPHKRGLTPSSLGAVIMQCGTIARLWDEALDLGFRSSSISFVEVMIAEHRLSLIASGAWNPAFSAAEESAKTLRHHVQNIHPELYIVQPEDVGAGVTDKAHILFCTSKIPDVDARVWAQVLSTRFNLDVEKATASTLLMICGSPTHTTQINHIISTMRDALFITIQHSGTSK